MSAAKRKTAKGRKSAAAKTGRAKSRAAKSGARTGAAKARAAKSRPPKREQAACEPELKLAKFLVDLATDQTKREAFDKDPDKAMQDGQLSTAAVGAIKTGSQNVLLRLICVSQQNT